MKTNGQTKRQNKQKRTANITVEIKSIHLRHRE